VAEIIKTTSKDTWSSGQAAALVVVCLLTGVAGGWLLRKSVAASSPGSGQAVQTAGQTKLAPHAAAPNFGMESPLPSAAQLKAAADEQAAPILQQLKADPNNAGLLASAGNIYYDAKQYPAAIDYYERALKVQPGNASVRTDLGTAYWYNGDADTAIAEFNKALSYEPNKADTLFNLGIVQWQAKKDGPRAIASWQKLLDTNPGYENREGVLQLISQAKQP
jgi:tetratricopeptide (TPR) repeat protein